MDSLPIELLVEIADFCDHPSQKALRVVSKDFRHVATPFVFEQVYLAMLQEPLANFESIAGSNHLAKHVKKVTFFCDIMTDFDCIEKYAMSLELKPDFTTWLEHDIRLGGQGEWQEWKAVPGQTLSARDIESGWEVYTRLWREQRL
ncbi:hypothetical protein CLAFUW4_00144 [Fulvia fulva]|uniref:F-box domain-containing protein n=1 Tax=Passalora fulva TaxID=5499 RepID=A0A9Q8L5R1_PASFU|nr:uncharacterized protein CLAFUR5_00142 [Fulvia fulva]KAK4635786.1 hypothetical protein CLAFUR4_00144 [Fulvia fulva]KAK4636364.1 hypothetical protein CLAFUR0_00142 [Fulvia fulva]UJO11314.1 hypothetical protein CLAFUR5_00142 [Fulvia fulva]WPV08915.1 hypothetical protein CLAFUW4_00144 [Fulvia fulva]WPV25252.1 hypothetical protein CLAFUW7_00144 [Fulvia fulva]